MSAEKSAEEKKRQQAGSWVLAFIGFILALGGIRYISSQGWWENRFDPSRRAYQTINTGLSVQALNQSEVSADSQSLNSGRPSRPPTSTDSNQNSGDSDQGQRALW